MSLLKSSEGSADLYNLAVDAWAMEITGTFLDNITSLGIVDTGRLFTALRYRLKSESGQTSQISWKAPRYGFVLANAGKSYTHSLDEGRRAVISEGGKRRYDKRVIGKGSSSTDWIYKALADGSENLGDIIAKITENRVVDASRAIALNEKISKSF